MELGCGAWRRISEDVGGEHEVTISSRRLAEPLRFICRMIEEAVECLHENVQLALPVAVCNKDRVRFVKKNLFFASQT